MQHQDVWKDIWGLTVGNKVRNFIWRVCKEAIRVKWNFMQTQSSNQR